MIDPFIRSQVLEEIQNADGPVEVTSVVSKVSKNEKATARMSRAAILNLLDAGEIALTNDLRLRKKGTGLIK